MSIGTILLIAVAVGVMFLMLRTAHSSRGAADRAGEAGREVGDLGDVGERAAADDQAENTEDGASRGHSHGGRGHGCC